MTTMKHCVLIAVLLLISGCGVMKQVAVVSHKTPIAGESVAPSPSPEKKETVRSDEPTQQAAVLSEPIGLEVEPPPTPRRAQAAPRAPETAAVPTQPVQQSAALPEPEVIEVEPLPTPRLAPDAPITPETAAVPEQPVQEVAVLPEPAGIEVETPPMPRHAPTPVPAQVEPPAPPPPVLSDILFDFDQHGIRKNAMTVLKTNATLLKTHYKNAALLIEGHCDERGTIEYNFVLGERRAQAVKSYLVDLGISASRIQTLSYGKEQPFCTEHNVQCWQQNRRAHFVLQ